MHSSRMRTVRSSSRLSRGGVCLSACWDSNPPPGTRHPRDQAPPQDRAHPPLPRGQTGTCKNITFATSLRTVIKFNARRRKINDLHLLRTLRITSSNAVKPSDRHNGKEHKPLSTNLPACTDRYIFVAAIPGDVTSMTTKCVSTEFM